MKKFLKKDLRKKLTSQQYAVTQEKTTEAPGTGCYLYNRKSGNYYCIVCDNLLFESKTKYDSGSGWPSFTRPVKGAVIYLPDTTMGLSRIEVLCAKCGAHLGHVFDDGPFRNKRYCINSASLNFVENKEVAAR